MRRTKDEEEDEDEDEDDEDDDEEEDEEEEAPVKSKTGGAKKRAAYWRAHADAMREHILTAAWSHERQAFAASFGASDLDASVLLMIEVGFIDAKDLQANAFKVVAERGTIFLMGRVTEREANRAADMARATSGVGKVVKVFEILSESELAALRAK